MRLALSLATAFLFVAPPIAFMLRSSAPLAWDAGDVTYKEKAKKLALAGDKGGLANLVKTDSAQAAAWIVRSGEILLDRSDDVEKALHDGLSDAWTTTIKTEFPAKFGEYLKAMTPESKKLRLDLKRRLAAAQSDIERNRETKDALMFVQAAEELENVGSAFEQEGDDYYASEAWLALAECVDEPLRGTAADLHKAWEAWGKCVDERAKLDLKDRRFDEGTKRRAALLAKGYDKKQEGAPGAGSEPGAPAQPASDAGATVTVPLTFDALSAPDAIARPHYQADEIYDLWNGLPLAGKGSKVDPKDTNRPVVFPADAPVLYRFGSSDLRFDVDGDGRVDGPTDEKIAITGNMTPFKISLGKGDSARPWAFFGVTGIQQDTYEGIQMNLSPDDNQMTIYTLSAGSVVGTLETTPIRLIDDTLDGSYGSEPKMWNYDGLTSVVSQPDMDSIVVGTSKRARPWSEMQEIGGKWWKLEATDGRQLKASPIKVETGVLKLDFKGATPNFVVVHGTVELKNCYFDLVEGGTKGINVPVGRYTLFYGDLRKGKKRQMSKLLILPGKTPLNYDVKKGETTTVTLGAPFNFDFTFKNADGKVKITGGSVVILGSAGERYERPWNCVARPEAAWRKKGTKKPSKYEKMPPVMDIEMINKNGRKVAWFPGDLELDAKGAGDVEVQLVDKKHEFFGKIESQWRE